MYSHFEKSFAARFVPMALVAGVLALSACDKKPEGQVVAVVNDDEITVQELNAELASMEVPAGASTEEARSRALDNIITRQLMADLARSQGIDEDPEFVVRRQQLEEALLVQMLANGTAKQLDEPSDQAVRAYISENPQMFADRAVLMVDQIRFPNPGRADYAKQLEPAKSMAEVATVLNRLGIRFERGNVEIDTASIPKEMYRQIIAVGNREPFVVPGTGGVAVSQIVSSKPAPLPPSQVTTAARNMMRQGEIAKQIDAKIKAAKAQAKIEYQKGYGAPAQPDAGGAKGVLENSKTVAGD